LRKDSSIESFQNSVNESSASENDIKNGSAKEMMPKIEKFNDDKHEMNFRKFLRIMKFKHRKNIMLHHIDRQIEHQICQNNHINEIARPKNVFDENFNLDPEQFENKEFQQN